MRFIPLSNAADPESPTGLTSGPLRSPSRWTRPSHLPLAPAGSSAITAPMLLTTALGDTRPGGTRIASMARVLLSLDSHVVPFRPLWWRWRRQGRNWPGCQHRSGRHPRAFWGVSNICLLPRLTASAKVPVPLEIQSLLPFLSGPCGGPLPHCVPSTSEFVARGRRHQACLRCPSRSVA